MLAKLASVLLLLQFTSFMDNVDFCSYNEYVTKFYERSVDKNEKTCSFNCTTAIYYINWQ